MKNAFSGKGDFSERIIYYPYKSDHTLILVRALRAFGYRAESLPEPNEENRRWARKYCSGKECLPGTLQAGDVIRKINEENFDPDKAAFYDFVGHVAPCRVGQYGTLIKLILDEFNCSDIPIYTHAYPDGKFLFPLRPNEREKIIRLMFNGMFAVDILIKALYETRPYEVVKGQTEEVYNKCLKKVLDAVENQRDIVVALKKSRELFNNVKVNYEHPRNVIGILGETYVRINRFANDNMIQKIESLGAEAWVAPLLEWQFAINYHARNVTLKKHYYIGYLKQLLREKIQRNQEQRMLDAFKGFLRSFCDIDLDKNVRKFKPYLNYTSVGCEVPWQIASTVEFIEKGADGIIVVMPFTCMNGNVFSAMLKEVRANHDNFPCLVLHYEGLEVTNIQTRLEAFIYQVEEYKATKKKEAG